MRIVILAETCCVLLNSFWLGSSNYHCPKLTALHRQLDCRGSFEFQPRHKQSQQAQGGATLKACAQWLRVNITFELTLSMQFFYSVNFSRDLLQHKGCWLTLIENWTSRFLKLVLFLCLPPGNLFFIIFVQQQNTENTSYQNHNFSEHTHHMQAQITKRLIGLYQGMHITSNDDVWISMHEISQTIYIYIYTCSGIYCCILQ